MTKTTFTINKESLQVVMDRVYKAPLELVFITMTNPKLIPEWWGPKIYTTTVEKDELKPGGVWRYVQKDSEGNSFAFHGEYIEIVPNKKIVRTFNFEGIPGDHELIETTILENLGGGKTKITSTSKFKNAEDLEGMTGSGMESGATETWERFALLVEKNIL